jgi:glycosyltransferase involved in cell wall biosynthesis
MSDLPVLLVNQYYESHRGAFNVFFGVERALPQIGYKPIVFASRTDQSLPSPFMHYFPRGFNRSQLASAPAATRIRYAADGLYSFRARRALNALIRDTRPAAAIVFRPEYQLSWSVLSELKRHRIPTILWIVDYRFWCTAGFLYNPALQQRCERCVGGSHWNAVRYRCGNGSLPMSIYDAASRTVSDTLLHLDRVPDRYVVPTNATRELIATHVGLAPERIHVIPHPVRLAEFETPSGQAPGDYAVFYGRLAPEKGLSTLLQAMRLTSAPDLEIYGIDIFGYKDRVRSEIERLALSHRIGVDTQIRFGEELLRRLSASLFVVSPSIWPDTLEYTVLESMALAKPVIVSEGGGNAEIVGRAGSGLRVPPGDPRALSEAMTLLTSDRELATRYGEAGRAYVRRELGEDRFASRLSELLATTLSGERAA